MVEKGDILSTGNTDNSHICEITLALTVDKKMQVELTHFTLRSQCWGRLSIASDFLPLAKSTHPNTLNFSSVKLSST